MLINVITSDRVCPSSHEDDVFLSLWLRDVSAMHNGAKEIELMFSG